MINKLLVLMLLFLSINANCEPLPKDSLEIKQLMAMGYDISTEVYNFWTVVANGQNKVAISKTKDRLAVIRFFSRKKNLSESDEFQLMKIINRYNADQLHQWHLGEDTVSAALYHYGDYDSRIFARLIRVMEMVDSVFSHDKIFLGLVNK